MRIIITILLIISLKGYSQDKKFHIYGKIAGLGETEILLSNKPTFGYGPAYKLIRRDSCTSKNGEFAFSGTVSEPGFYSIEIPSKGRNWIGFIVHGGNIYISGSADSLDNLRTTGSYQQELYEKYHYQVKRPLLRQQRLAESKAESMHTDKKSPEARKMVNDSVAYYNRKIENALYAFITEHPDSYGAMHELRSLGFFLPADSVKKYFTRFSLFLRNGTLGKIMHYDYFEYPELVQQSKPLPKFSLPDTSMRIRNINKMRGKYILLDFWASWCGPCIEELPRVKRLDSLYGNKGLQVVGISLDANRQAWTRSIIQHKIPWINLSDLEGEANVAARLLNVSSIPAKFLVDPEGNLLLIHSSLDEIEKMLSARLSP